VTPRSEHPLDASFQGLCSCSSCFRKVRWREKRKRTKRTKWTFRVFLSSGKKDMFSPMCVFLPRNRIKQGGS
jgi:hypothetical protein